MGLRFFDLPLFQGRTNRERRELNFAPPYFYRYKNYFLTMVRVSLRHHSSENMLIEPFFFDAIPSPR